MAKLGRILAVSIAALLAISYLGSTISPLLKTTEAQAVDETKGGRNWIMVDGNRNIGQAQFNPQTEINKQNVQLLEIKWIYPMPQSADIGGYRLSTQVGSQANPLVVDGIIYQPTNFGQIIALDASTGKVVWQYIPALNLTQDIARGVLTGDAAGGAGLGAGHTHGISYAEGKIYAPYPPCDIHVIDALTGKKVAAIADMCKGPIPGNEQMSYEEQKRRGFNVACSGNYKGAQSYGPTIIPKERIIIQSAGPNDEGSRGARGFFAAYDMDTYKLLWRFFLSPPHGGDPEWAVRVADKGWIQGVKASTLPREVLLNDWGDARCVSTGPAWGEYTYDEETGIVYVATVQPSPQANATFRPGPNVFSNSIMALKYKTGELVWWHQTTTHDIWDWDCSWALVFAKINFGPPRGEKKAVFKGCKNAMVYMLDAATGEAIWTFNPPTISRAEYAPTFFHPGHSQADYKQIPNLSPPPGSQLKSQRDGHVMAAWDPRDPDIYKLKWWNEPRTDPVWTNPNCGIGGIEADVAYAYNTIYVGTYNFWCYNRVVNVGPGTPGGGSGRIAVPPPTPRETNTTFYALDATTGKPKWSFFMGGVGFRAGNTVSGGLVYLPTADGMLRALDADTGKVIWEKFFGGGLNTPPVIAATADGKFRLFQVFGRNFAGVGQAVPGGLIAMGLPDKLPEPQVVTKEVVKEVVKEVPKEVIKEVVKEVPKEVTKTVTVETVSPISYAVVGVGVVLIVVAGVIVSRRKKV